MGINPNNLNSTISSYVLYAHTNGVVSDILKPLHSSVSKDDELFSVIQEQSFYLKSYIPLEYANDIKVGQKVSLKYNKDMFDTTIERILPEVDLQTQRIVSLSPLEKNSDNLFANVFVPSTIYFDTNKKYISVKKTALSFLNNEWVVFIPKKEEHIDKNEHQEDENHKDEDGHEKEHKNEDSHKDEKAEESHNEEPQYEARDVKIIDQDDTYVAIEGLNVNEEYVSDNAYYVKSLVLKSSMGDGHGH